MVEKDAPKLQRLLKAERLAFERYERRRGYSGDIQEAAQALLTEASEALRDYRAKHPPRISPFAKRADALAWACRFDAEPAALSAVGA